MRITKTILQNNLAVLNKHEGRPTEGAKANGRLHVQDYHMDTSLRYAMYEVQHGKLITQVVGLTNREMYQYINGRLDTSPIHKKTDAPGACPYCGAEHSELDYPDGVEVDGNSAWQKASCKKCGAEWNEVYDFAFIEGTYVPKKVREENR